MPTIGVHCNGNSTKKYLISMFPEGEECIAHALNANIGSTLLRLSHANEIFTAV
jgi:hypothetical protein